MCRIVIPHLLHQLCFRDTSAFSNSEESFALLHWETSYVHELAQALEQLHVLQVRISSSLDFVHEAGMWIASLL